VSIYAYAVVASDLVRQIRRDARLSVRALARAAGVAASTVHRIERGDVTPTADVLDRIATAAGVALRVEPHVDHRRSLVGLALCIADDLERDAGGPQLPIRRAAELVQRFDRSDRDMRARMVAARPPSTGDIHWDAFIGALAEWLSVRTDMEAPEWAFADDRQVSGGWWVTDLPSMRAWELAGSPASFKLRGVYLHRDSLVNV
jgi:transcriptional regulator with XRE-family HTH domain